MSKQAILDALKTSAMADVAMPELKSIGNQLSQAELESRLETNLATVAGKLEPGGIEALKAHTQSLMAQGKVVLSLVDGVPGNRELTASPHALADVDFAVIPGELAVAENGAVWVTEAALSQGEQAARIAPFICENLLLVVRRDAIVADMHQAMGRIGKLEDKLGFGVFIAGPSKTADIEQALVVGAHGACSLGLYLI